MGVVISTTSFTHDTFVNYPFRKTRIVHIDWEQPSQLMIDCNL